MPGMQASRRYQKARGAPQGSLLHRTKMCSFFERGACERGERCTYAHAAVELKPAPDLHCTKLCPKGMDCLDSECRFAHRQAELRVVAVPAPAKQTLNLVELCRFAPEQPPGSLTGLAASKSRRRHRVNSPTPSRASTKAPSKFSSNSTQFSLLLDFCEVHGEIVDETDAPSSGCTSDQDTTDSEAADFPQEPEKISLADFATIWMSATLVNTFLEFRPEKPGLRRVKSSPLF